MSNARRIVEAELPDHLFTGDSTGGDLYDTRKPGWSGKPPLRTNYKRTHREIKSVADLKATLRAGEFAWPGGYQMYFITDDGAALSFKTVKEEFPRIAASIRDNSHDGWRVIGCDINYEDNDLTDDHTGEKIPSAYGDAAAPEGGEGGEPESPAAE